MRKAGSTCQFGIPTTHLSSLPSSRLTLFHRTVQSRSQICSEWTPQPHPPVQVADARVPLHNQTAPNSCLRFLRSNNSFHCLTIDPPVSPTFFRPYLHRSCLNLQTSPYRARRCNAIEPTSITLFESQESLWIECKTTQPLDQH